VECDARLVPLFTRSFPGVSFFARRDAPDIKADFQAPLGHLGALFRKSFSDFPQRDFYLKAGTQKTLALQAKYRARKPGGKIIGISWKSKKLRQGDPKSTALADWKSLFENSPHLFVNLQYGAMPEELAALQLYTMKQSTSRNRWMILRAGGGDGCGDQRQQHHCAYGGRAWREGRGAAARFARLDGHWFDNGEKSPWYPSLTLLRQSTDGDWRDVMRRAEDFIR